MAMSFEHGAITVLAKGVRAEASRDGVILHATEGKTREEAVAAMRQWLTQFPLPVVVAEVVAVVELASLDAAEFFLGRDPEASVEAPAPVEAPVVEAPAPVEAPPAEQAPLLGAEVPKSKSKKKQQIS